MAAQGFTWQAGKAGDVKLFHHGKLATTLRRRKAQAFLDLTAAGDEGAAQLEAARLTGNYKRGNERLSKGHARNA